MALNRDIKEPEWLRKKKRELCQEKRALTSGRKASVDRPAWWLFMSRTTMALITMKRSWESMRLAGNTMGESRGGSHVHCSRMGHEPILPPQLLPTPPASECYKGLRLWEKRDSYSHANSWSTLQGCCQYYSQVGGPAYDSQGRRLG